MIMSSTKGGIVVSKQEMTKMWVGDKFVAVTLAKVLPQEIIRYKTQEKDGYSAVVVGVEKKELNKEKGQRLVYSMVTEFPVDEAFVSVNEAGKVLDTALLEGVSSLAVTGMTKGKGYQGLVKRCNVKGGPATHGHKFSRAGGSKGNRKPRRTMKGHPHAGHMGSEQLTLKRIPLLNIVEKDGVKFLIVKGSLPGARNGKLKCFVE